MVSIQVVCLSSDLFFISVYKGCWKGLLRRSSFQLLPAGRGWSRDVDLFWKFSQSCEFDRSDYVGCRFDRGDYVEAPAMSEQLSVCLPSGLLLIRVY